MDENKMIDEILSRGVTEVIEKESLRKKLSGGEKLRVKLGIDPTGPSIHLGRAIPLRKLREFQNLGHTAVLIVGDFTARIGDPSDKLEKRPTLTVEKIKENMRSYKKLVGKILDLKKTEFVYNSKWLSKLKFEDVFKLAESFSFSQMSERRNFKERLSRGEEVLLPEILYPLMQGYDSVAVRADVEVGGNDQLFNLLAGRTIQKHYGVKEQDILMTKMLSGTDGRKMSTSWGNVIFIDEKPEEMFGKIMSLKDDLLEEYFSLATALKEEEIKKILSENSNPRDAKLILAENIVALYHGERKAKSACQNFVKVFSKKEIPENVPEISADGGSALEILARAGLGSNTEIRRLILSGAITNLDTKEKISDPNQKLSSGTYRIGKHRFIKIV